MSRFAIAALAVLGPLPSPAADPAPPRYDDRWVWCMHNLQVDANADKVVALVERAGKAGYTGLVLADYKMNFLARMGKGYFHNVDRVKAAAAAAKVEIIPAVFPLGYSNGLLANDPNLAEGLPVVDAPFTAKGGRLVPAPAVTLKNGSFEDAKGDKFAGLSFQDGVGKSTFADRAVVCTGAQSLRLESTADNCRVSQKVKVRPFACYRLSAKVRTKDLGRCDFHLAAIAAGGRPLTFMEGSPKPDQDWTAVDVVFNSLDAAEVTVYAGVWGGFKGTIWVDDWALEELALVNVLRRPACPLTVTSADGTTTYQEGVDFEPVRDPKLGVVPYAGEYRFDHPGAEVKLTPKSRITDGGAVKVSYYHPILIHAGQVPCCLSDPKVFALLEDQAKRVHELWKPKTWFMNHDEIRATGWDAEQKASGKTPGRLLADNVRRCTGIIRGLNPAARVAVWSDMFDPTHNARDKYYLVNGTLEGSWEGLDPAVIVANWNSGKAAASLKFFADRGHPQVLAGYYDAAALARGFGRWDAAAAGVPGVRGFMYTTWKNQYAPLEEYGKAIGRR